MLHDKRAMVGVCTVVTYHYDVVIGQSAPNDAKNDITNSFTNTVLLMSTVCFNCHFFIFFLFLVFLFPSICIYRILYCICAAFAATKLHGYY